MITPPSGLRTFREREKLRVAASERVSAARPKARPWATRLMPPAAGSRATAAARNAAPSRQSHTAIPAAQVTSTQTAPSTGLLANAAPRRSWSRTAA